VDMQDLHPGNVRLLSGLGEVHGVALPIVK